MGSIPALNVLYVRAGNELLATMRPGGSGGMWTTRFVHSDGLGSVRALTDESGAVVETRSYEAFGTKNAQAGSDPLVYGFAGEPFDATSKLAYHRARWMDARVGRFTSTDPVIGTTKNPVTLHRYLYTANSPINYVDPSGEFSIPSMAGIVTIVGITAMMGATTKNHDSYLRSAVPYGRVVVMAVGNSEATGSSKDSEILDMRRHSGGTIIRIRMTNIRTLSSLINSMPDSHKISEFHFYDHGSCTEYKQCNFKFGGGTDSSGMWAFAKDFQAIGNHMDPQGVAYLHQCEAGQDRRAMTTLASNLGVKVIASTGANTEIGSEAYGTHIVEFTEGTMTTCWPNGQCEP